MKLVQSDGDSLPERALILDVNRVKNTQWLVHFILISTLTLISNSYSSWSVFALSSLVVSGPSVLVRLFLPVSPTKEIKPPIGVRRSSMSSSCGSSGYYSSSPTLSSSPPVLCNPKSGKEMHTYAVLFSSLLANVVRGRGTRLSFWNEDHLPSPRKWKQICKENRLTVGLLLGVSEYIPLNVRWLWMHMSYRDS